VSAGIVEEFVSIAERAWCAGLIPVPDIPDGFPAAPCRIEPFGDGLYQPSRTGLPAIITTVWDEKPLLGATTEDGTLVMPDISFQRGIALDLAAIDVTPERIYLRRGMAICLGQHLLAATNLTELSITFSPTQWIYNGGEGVCPIDGEEFAKWCLDRPRLNLLPDNVNDGRRLRALFNKHRAPLPRIRGPLPRPELVT
jgi:hypothetical protein